MCYLVRQQQPHAAPGAAPQPPDSQGLRPRWVGAAALALVGGVALAAALVSNPPPSQQQPLASEPGAPAPLASRPASPAGGVVEQTSMSLDDGVPASKTDLVKSGAGGCSHGL